MKIFLKNIQKKDIKKNDVYVVEDKENIHHVLNVMRKEIGDNIELGISDKTYNARIINKKPLEVEIIDECESNELTKVSVDIFQGLPKANKMEYIIEKSVELRSKQYISVKNAKVSCKNRS